MKKKTKARTEEDRCNALIDKWEARFCADWDLRRVFRYDDAPMDGSLVKLASSDADWTYRLATISIFVNETKKISRIELEKVIMHEMIHILLNELRSPRVSIAYLAHEERVVTDLTRAFWK